MKKLVLALNLTLITAAIAIAQPTAQEVESKLNGAKIEKIEKTNVKGIYELYVQDFNIPLYISEDGRYLIEGQITDLDKRVNLTEERQNRTRLKELESIDTKDMIIYSPKGEKKHTLTVFTDVNCPYCKKFHDEINDYLDAGIEVRYLAFPAIATQERMESVWCAEDPKKAFELAKGKGNVDNKVKCEGKSSVGSQYLLGRSFGITGTPNIILENGQMIGGYVPSVELIRVINEMSL